MRIETFKRDKGDTYVYPPSHKQWIQLFKRYYEGDTVEYIETGEIIEEVITDYAYQMKVIDYKEEYEEEVVIIDDEKKTLSLTEYLYKHFDELF